MVISPRLWRVKREGLDLHKVRLAYRPLLQYRCDLFREPALIPILQHAFDSIFVVVPISKSSLGGIYTVENLHYILLLVEYMDYLIATVPSSKKYPTAVYVPYLVVVLASHVVASMKTYWNPIGCSNDRPALAYSHETDIQSFFKSIIP